jgi:hypothetical protein
LIPIFELVKASGREWFRDCQVLELEDFSVWMSESGQEEVAGFQF